MQAFLANSRACVLTIESKIITLEEKKAWRAGSSQNSCMALQRNLPQHSPVASNIRGDNKITGPVERTPS